MISQSHPHHRHQQQRQQQLRREPQQQQQQQKPRCSMVPRLLIGMLGVSALLSADGIPTAASASPLSPSRGAVDDNDDDDNSSDSLFLRRYHRRITARRHTTIDVQHYPNQRRAQFFDDDDDDFDDDDDDTVGATGGGGVVCESVIAIASTRLFHAADDLEEEEDEDIDDSSSSASSHENGRFRFDTTRRKKKKKKNKVKVEAGDEEFVCELITGDTVPISATPQQVDELREALADGSLVSAVSTISVQEVTVVTTTTTNTTTTTTEEGGGGDDAAPSSEEGDGVVVVSQEVVEIAMMEEDMAQEVVQEVIASSSIEGGGDGSKFIESVSLPPGSIQLQSEGTARRRRQLLQRQRELASYTGTKPVLVVRVTDVNGLAPAGDARFMSDKFFGTYGDTETMVSQFASCSYGAFRIVTQQYPQLSAPGVLDVQIPISLRDNARDAIRKAVHGAVAAKLGFSATPGPFAHVLYVVEKCYVDCGWAAYAYVNSWLSVYHSNFYMYPAVSLHEIGHNLNLGHSGGLDGKTYTDHSCLMGNPLFSDDVADMCYNPAKTHQLIMSSSGSDKHTGNWYDASRVSTWNPGSGGSSWSGKFVGVAEYGQISNGGGGDRRLVLRIVSGGSTDLYVGFNRKTGINEDNKQGSDMVTVIEAGAGGNTYSTSFLKATLQQGRSYYIPNWRGDGSSLEIFVDAIRTDVVPGYAIVRAAIAGSGGPANPPTNPPTRVPATPRPTRVPTPLPTPKPSLSPVTNYPSLSPVTNYPSQSPVTYNPSQSPVTYNPSQSPVTNYPTLSPVTNNPSLTPTFPPVPNPTPYPTFSPTTYPPSLSPDKELATGLDTSGRRVRGIMFTVTAKDHDVIITGMDVISRRNIQSDITIYTKPGPYRTDGNISPLEVDLHAEEWQEIYRGSIPSQPQKLVSLDDFNVSVTIAAGQTQSFYTYVSNGLLYTTVAAAPGSSTEGLGFDVGSTVAEDDGIIIHEGQVMRGIFQKVVGRGRWGGVMRYRMMA